MSDVKYDPELCERLVADIRSEVARTPYAAHRAVVADQLEAARKEVDAAIAQRDSWKQQAEDNMNAGCRIAADRELMRTVVDAADAWRSVAPANGFGVNTDALVAAIDAYRAAKGKAGT